MRVADDIKYMAESDPVLQKFLDLEMPLFYGDWQLIRDHNLQKVCKNILLRNRTELFLPILLFATPVFQIWKPVLFGFPSGREPGLLIPSLATGLILAVLIAGGIYVRRLWDKYKSLVENIANGTAIAE
jgi:hypothetical protein